MVWLADMGAASKIEELLEGSMVAWPHPLLNPLSWA